jgi:ornithine cyclodeaminase
MKVLIINRSEVQKLLPMRECIELMAEALKTVARGDAVLPLRSAMWLPDKTGLLGMMPAYLKKPEIMGLKVVTVFTGNQGTEYESHLGAVMLFETHHGQLQAIIDGSEITAIRTAAVSGVATRLLSRENARDLALLGSGTQSRRHLEAMVLVRKIRRVRVWSLSFEHAQGFAQQESERYGITIEAMETAQAAVEGADIICTTTSAVEPILLGKMLSDGAHINAVGACSPMARELDTKAIARSRLFVDKRESTLSEAGDFLIPKSEGAIGDNHIVGEIGEILLGRAEARKSKNEITLFESLGLAIEDLASAEHIYRQALKKDMGIAVELGGGRHDSA